MENTSCCITGHISCNENHLLESKLFPYIVDINGEDERQCDNINSVEDLYDRVTRLFISESKKEVIKENKTKYQMINAIDHSSIVSYDDRGSKVLIKDENEENILSFDINYNNMLGRDEEDSFTNSIHDIINAFVPSNYMQEEMTNNNNNNIFYSDNQISEIAEIVAKSIYSLPSSLPSISTTETTVELPSSPYINSIILKYQPISNSIANEIANVVIDERPVKRREIAFIDVKELPLKKVRKKISRINTAISTPVESENANISVTPVESNSTNNANTIVANNNFYESPEEIFKKLSAEYIERHNFKCKEQISFFEKYLYKKSNGSTFEYISELEDTKEMNERKENNLIPPQPEYFDSNIPELGYKCCYDVKHPHPYKNPFEMFVYVNEYKRKLISSNGKKKYACQNLSKGRIVCLLCAILHGDEIKNLKQLQDWDVIDIYGNSVRSCTSCKKEKNEDHYGKEKYHKQCTFCASHRTFVRCIDCDWKTVKIDE